MRKEQRQETGTVSYNEYKGFGSDLQTMATERMVRPWQSQEGTREHQGKGKENSPQFCHLTVAYDTQFKIPNP